MNHISEQNTCPLNSTLFVHRKDKVYSILMISTNAQLDFTGERQERLAA